MTKTYSANEIRQMFIDFFVKKKGHRFVPSSSLVPGGDATLLFTNSGMVQFKDIFLGTDKRDYQRAVNSQKCMRVAGKHNDLEDVGFNDSHHTFFEMLGNWSFGDYYKEEAIEWGWELFTEVWGLPKDKLYFTVFRDELGEIPADDEAVEAWKKQPGLDHEHIIYLGRDDNFWEMADTGPCGPNSEIHIDLGPEYGEIEYREDGQIDLDNGRFLELWNLVFIQFNRTGPKTLKPLPNQHVDTGLGLERIVSVLQGQTSNYRTDLFTPIIDKIQELAKHNDKERDEHFTPYRVIADHGRAATFLIADGVVPGNIGRNYVTRMIIRRAARFGSKIGLDEPFLAKVAERVIENYGEAYPELVKYRETILDNLTREEERFQRTVESGVANLETLLKELESKSETVLDGGKAFDLYATYGLPFEITRDIAQERGLDVEETAFREAMETHRLASGAGQAMGELGGEDAEVFREIFDELQSKKKLDSAGVEYDPYGELEVEGIILAIVREGKETKSAKKGDEIEIILPETCFYVASGGQVSDSGTIVSVKEPHWEILVKNTRKASAGMIAHSGMVVKGTPKVGDLALAAVDRQRRQDIMRNHTATHLLHAELHAVLGEHARQAGSLVAPERLRFDFTHNDPVTSEQISQIEAGVNRNILENYELAMATKSLDEAKAEGAMALFGEKYGETVRTISIGKGEEPFSYELCGGTHVRQTSDIGTFLIISEGSAAAGIRRIEAVTGREAYKLIRQRKEESQKIAVLLNTNINESFSRINSLMKESAEAQSQLMQIVMQNARNQIAHPTITELPQNINLITEIIANANNDVLRLLADEIREKFDDVVAVFASTSPQPTLITYIADSLVKQGLHAGQLANYLAKQLGGGGGGKPSLGQAGGKDVTKLDEVLKSVPGWVKENLKAE